MSSTNKHVPTLMLSVTPEGGPWPPALLTLEASKDPANVTKTMSAKHNDGPQTCQSHTESNMERRAHKHTSVTVVVQLLDEDWPKGGSKVRKDVGLSLPSAAARQYVSLSHTHTSAGKDRPLTSDWGEFFEHQFWFFLHHWHVEFTKVNSS